MKRKELFFCLLFGINEFVCLSVCVFVSVVFKFSNFLFENNYNEVDY